MEIKGAIIVPRNSRRDHSAPLPRSGAEPRYLQDIKRWVVFVSIESPMLRALGRQEAVIDEPRHAE
jgi:hypothetical protein